MYKQCGLVYFLRRPYQLTEDCIHLFYCVREHYVNMYIVALWRESVPMGLNEASKEASLTASHECPVAYVSLSHTHTQVDIILQDSEETHLCQGWTRASGGSLSFTIAGYPTMNAGFVNSRY